MSVTHHHQKPSSTQDQVDATGLRVEVIDGASSTTVRIHGELDAATAPGLGERLDELSRAGRTIELDLSPTTFIDSAGIRVLVRSLWAAQSAGAALTIVATSPAAENILRITRHPRHLEGPEPMTDPLRVILANDHELILEGLRGLLAPYSDRIEVIATAVGEPDIVQEGLIDSDADIMLLDAFGRIGAGVDAVAKVLAADPPFSVVVFTEADDLRHLFAALRSGVRGYLLKSIPTAGLVDSLERVAKGDVVIDPGLATEAAIMAARTTSRQRWVGAHLGLSRREAEVLRCVAHGRSVDEVASELGVGRETIRTHLQQIYRKLGVNDRAGAVAKAWREGLAE